MNFYGHATVATWYERHPRFVLGSMLPDFASMAGARLRGAEDPLVARGIELHHQTDDVFHRAALFLRLSETGADELIDRGLGRGPARAVAHIGTELLLDGLLLEDSGDELTKEAYLGAVAAAEASDLGLEFRREEGSDRFQALSSRLSGYGLPLAYRDPEMVFVRLTQALHRRPRLALVPEDEAVVVPWLRQTRRVLEEEGDGLVREVREGVDARRGG